MGCLISPQQVHKCDGYLRRVNTSITDMIFFFTGGIINPWTGEDMSSVINSDKNDDSSGQGGKS